jgi:trimethylamine--corrinoid protein Co-methyltransferase
MFAGEGRMVAIRFLSDERLQEIHEAASKVLAKTGVAIQNRQARELLLSAGGSENGPRIRLPERLVWSALEEAPSDFGLYNMEGTRKLTIGKGAIAYNPGSSAANFRDRVSGEIRKGRASDLSELAKIADVLPTLSAQSTALVASDVPSDVADLYRLYAVLSYSSKPVVTGAFTKAGLKRMLQLLAVFTGGLEPLSKTPVAIFDCCPVSPLTWGDVAAQNLIDCAEHEIPAEIVPAPLIGATSPITLIGTLVQSHAEIMAGIVLAQTTRPGAPVIYGGAHGVLDMKHATPRFSAVEANIAVCASAEIGRYLGLPTQAYLGGSDSKLEDAQAGFEACIGLVLGALSGIDVVSGPGMLAALDCQSVEKLVIDNEICGVALRLVQGVSEHPMDAEEELIEQVGAGGDFLGSKHTRLHLRSEHIFPSSVVDRVNRDSWLASGSKSAYERAKSRVDELLESYQRPRVCINHASELGRVFKSILVDLGVSMKTTLG